MKSRIWLALATQLSLLSGCGGGGSGSGGAGAVAPSMMTQPTDQRVVVGAAATFSLSANGTAPLSYLWQKGTPAIPGATASSFTPPPPPPPPDPPPLPLAPSHLSPPL